MCVNNQFALFFLSIIMHYLLLLLLHSFSGLFSRSTWVSLHQKSRSILVNQSGFTGEWDSELQWHQLGHMQICTSPHTDNHASRLHAECPSCRPTNSVKTLKALKALHIVVSQLVTWMLLLVTIYLPLPMSLMLSAGLTNELSLSCELLFHKMSIYSFVLLLHIYGLYSSITQ